MGLRAKFADQRLPWERTLQRDAEGDQMVSSEDFSRSQGDQPAKSNIRCC